jgi:hypothetical protein
MGATEEHWKLQVAPDLRKLFLRLANQKLRLIGRL